MRYLMMFVFAATAAAWYATDGPKAHAVADSDAANVRGGACSWVEFSSTSTGCTSSTKSGSHCSPIYDLGSGGSKVNGEGGSSDCTQCGNMCGTCGKVSGCTGEIE